jgi:hypothetical protein
VRLERRGDEIVVCGQLFHTTAPVVLWTDPGGYDAYRVERRFVPPEKATWAEAQAAGIRSPNRYGNRDAALTPEQVARVHAGGWALPDLQGVVDQFVEFFGPGLERMSVPDRATVANMAPEYGATTGFFPVDQKTLDYLRLTGRSAAHVDLVERYAKERGYIDLFARTGVEVIKPGCGACIGCGPGVSEKSDQVTVSAINRNYKGRSGPGRLYLASPLTVAASAVAGEIVEYRDDMFAAPA